MVTLHNKQIGCQAPFLNDVQVLSNNPIWQWKFPHTFIEKNHSRFIDWSITRGYFPMQWGPSSTKTVGKTTQLAADGIPGQSAREDLHHATAEHLCRKGWIFVAEIGRDSKWNMQLRKLPPFSISRTSSCYLEAARFLALIRSNGYVLVEPEKCLEPSLLTSTDSHVFWQEDSREQRGCTTQTLIPSLCRIQVAKRGTSFAILQLTRFTLHWDPTQTSYKNAKLGPKKHACELC